MGLLSRLPGVKKRGRPKSSKSNEAAAAETSSSPCAPSHAATGNASHEILKRIKSKSWDDLRSFLNAIEMFAGNDLGRGDDDEGEISSPSRPGGGHSSSPAPMLASLVSNCDFAGWNALHLLFIKGSPRDLIEKLAQLCPREMLYQQDVAGRTPLHVCIECGYGREGIDCLLKEAGRSGNNINKRSKLAKIVDARGRTALALAAEHAGLQARMDDEKRSKMGGRGITLGAIRALTLAYPPALSMEDCGGGGKTPLKLAEEHGAPQDILRALRKATERVEKKMMEKQEQDDSSSARGARARTRGRIAEERRGSDGVPTTIRIEKIHA